MDSTPDTRYTLIGKIRNPQDADAWAEFTSIYQPLIFRIVRARGLQHADATDITQDVLAKVASVIEKFSDQHPTGSFRGWLYRITRNVVVDFLRKQSKNPLVYSEQTMELTADADPTENESAEFQREFQKQIFWVVAKTVRTQVKPATWQAFWSTEIERQSVEQVAKNLKITVGSVYVSRSRVIARLRKEAQKKLSETSTHFA